MSFAEVAIPVPLRQTFTYRIPDAYEGKVRPGLVVQVPFGARTLNGFVVELTAASPLDTVKDISAVMGDELSLPDEVLNLCRWVSDYYLAPLGEVLRAALPSGLGRRSPGEVPHAEGKPPTIQLDDEQAVALDALTRSIRDGDAASFLLFGITGSGKTEVYLRAAQETVAAGGKVLILIPEIALSPQMVSRVENRFGNRVALWHSALTPARRRQVWERTRKGEIDVLVGARSAVFAPLPDLRLVVVDEEHESAYKQSERPRYHARDVALVRARFQKATAVLGSATPSLESFENVKKGKYRLLTLPRRVAGRRRSTVELVPIPRADMDPRPISLILSDRLRQEMASVISRKEQCILFLNRRGHSTSVQCERRRHVLQCTQCDISMTWHSVGNKVVCHYCGRRVTPPDTCPECGDLLSVYKGVGTQQVVREIERLFAGVRVIRMDTDSMKKRGSLEDALERFRNAEADVLLGTQMVAKGLDFPGVTLVGVINADLQLALPDFRSAERTFQLLTQVAGRSGRGDLKGKVIFQTNHPDHYALVAAAAQDYPRFFDREMETRRDPAYPPYVRLVNLLFDGRSETGVIRAAEAALEFLEKRLPEGETVQFLGPAPQPFSRLKGKHRWHITLRGRNHRTLRNLAESLLEREDETPSRAVRLSVDVDPVSLL